MRQYELGKRKPRLEQIQKIAKALDVPPVRLVGEDWETIQYEGAIEHQPIFLQYLFSLGYVFEYVGEPNISNLPENNKRKPTLIKGGERTTFTEEQFQQFEKAISDSVDYRFGNSVTKNKNRPDGCTSKRCVPSDTP